MAVHAKVLLHNTFLRKIVYNQCRFHADYVLDLMEPYLRDSDRILDLGSGNCVVSEILREHGYTVTPVDIENLSLVSQTQPLLYDGETLPFEDDAFDVVLLTSVLHHTKQPKDILKEAMRVSRRVLILEDTFSNSLQKYITFSIDSVNNQEFRGHPHSNKTDREWKTLFDELGFRLRDTKYKRWLLFITHALYYVEKTNTGDEKLPRA